MRVTAPSAWSWLDHVVSGLIRLTQRPIQTRFRYASALRLKLARQTNSLTHYTKGTRSELAFLPLFVGVRFQVYFTPLVGVLFTFPSRYLFAIGHQLVFSLGGWSPQIQTGFHVSGSTQVPVLSVCLFVYGTITLCRPTFQMVRLRFTDLLTGPTTPISKDIGLGSSHFARRYLGNLF